MIRIVTDSTASICQKEANELGIDVVPLYVLIADKTYKDRIDFTDDEFYELLEKHQPTTSQPNPVDFLTVYNKYPNDEIICITLSKELSGTFQSASIAKDMSDNKRIAIINSENVSLGLRSLVLLAVNMKNEGYRFDDIIEKIEQLKHKVITLGMADTLENLKRGGRISNIKFIAANFLNIKPLIIVSDGVLQSYGKNARGKNNAIRIISNALDTYHYDHTMPITLGYAHDRSNAILLNEQLKKYGVCIPENDFLEVGSVIATHTGKNAFIMSFFKQ